MSNPFYTPTGSPATSSTAASSTMRNEFNAIEDGFDKLATLSGNSNLPVFINTGETGQEAVSIATALTRFGLPANLATLTLPASVTISAFGATIIDDANAAAVIATLGLDVDIATLSLPASTTISAFAKTVLDDADAATVRATIGAGDVTAAANLTDNALVRGDGGAKGVQPSTVLVSDAGEMTNPNQPTFLVILNGDVADVTGDGTEYTVICNTEIFDQNADYNPATGIFTAPVTGKYLFVIQIRLEELLAAHNEHGINFYTSNRTYVPLYDSFTTSPFVGTKHMSFTIICDMDAADTAYFTVIIAGSTKTVNIGGHATISLTSFSGQLIN